MLNTKDTRLPVKYNGEFSYDIVFNNEFEQLKDELLNLDLSFKKICIVTDSNVGPIYAEKLKEILEPIAQVVIFQFEAGEKNKHLGVIEEMYETLILNKFDRKDIMIALGGGVVGDMTGFCAATYLRGIDFIQVPTSLLAQVDSSVGGKTGVDFKKYKNMVGAFKMPKLVYMNLSSLNSLPEREYLSGMGEIIKHGLIQDKDFYNWLKENKDKIIDKDYDTLKTMVLESCNIKREVVEIDPTEKGIRATLNFGHTIGHAVEKEKNFSLLHGECVCIGMVAASLICNKLGKISDEELADIIKTIEEFKLPVLTSDIDAKSVLDATFNDKKMEGGKVKFVLLEEIGKAYITKELTNDIILDACNYVIK